MKHNVNSSLLYTVVVEDYYFLLYNFQYFLNFQLWTCITCILILRQGYLKINSGEELCCSVSSPAYFYPSMCIQKGTQVLLFPVGAVEGAVPGLQKGFGRRSTLG